MSVGRRSSSSPGVGFARSRSRRVCGCSPRSAAWRSSTGWRVPPIDFYISVTVERVVPTVVLAGRRSDHAASRASLVADRPGAAPARPVDAPSPDAVAGRDPAALSGSSGRARRRPPLRRTDQRQAERRRRSPGSSSRSSGRSRRSQGTSTRSPRRATGRRPDGLSYTVRHLDDEAGRLPADRPHLERGVSCVASLDATRRAVTPTGARRWTREAGPAARAAARSGPRRSPGRPRAARGTGSPCRARDGS